MIDTEAFRQFEKAGWDERAANYDRFFTAVSDHNIQPILDASSIGPGLRVLDCACGAGNLAAAAAARGASVIGIDIAERVVAGARAHHPHVDFRVADAEHLSFPDAEFDAVISNLLIPHLPRPESGVAEMVRVLKPRGRLVASMWDMPSRSRLTGVIWDAVMEVGAPPPPGIPAGPPTFRYSDEGALADLMRSAGLDKVGVERVEFTHAVQTSDEVWNAWTQGSVRTAAQVRGQPQEVQLRIRAAFDRLMSAYAAGGGFKVPVAFLIASGTRR